MEKKNQQGKQLQQSLGRGGVGGGGENGWKNLMVYLNCMTKRKNRSSVRIPRINKRVHGDKTIEDVRPTIL